MAEWNFTCGCCQSPLGPGLGMLTLEATDEEDANQKARDAGWIVDWKNYPGVACSQACWQKFHDEWERRRPAREAAREERRQEQRDGLWTEDWRPRFPACTDCGAEAGAPCVGADRPTYYDVHESREKAWKAARGGSVS